MDEKTAEQILTLATKWQQNGNWEIAYEAADSFREYRRKSNECFAITKKWQDKGWQQDSALKLFERDAELYAQNSEDCHRHVITAHQEFCELVRVRKRD